MALAQLLRALEDEAATEAAALRESARADAERIRTDAAAQRERRLREELERHATIERAMLDMEIAAASRRTRASVLEARAAALERVRSAVVAMLPEIVGDLRVQLKEAARAAAGERAVFESTPTGERATRGGVVIDATLDALLARLWPRLRLEVAP